MTETDGAIYVGVLPDLGGFDAKLREEARRAGLKFGHDFADSFDAALGPAVRQDVRQAVTTATKAAPKVQVDTQLRTQEAQSQLQKFGAQKAEVQAKVTADTAAAQVQIDRLTRQQARLQAKVDLDDADAKAKVAALEAGKVQVQAKVDVSTAEALAKVAAIDRKIGELGGRARVRVDADTSGADTSIGQLIGKIDRTIGSAGGLAGALAAIGPAAVPSLLAAAAGATALGAAVGGAAAVSLGTGLLAFSGLDDALKALNEQQSTAARTAAQASNATQQLAARHLAAAGAADQLKQAQAALVNTQANVAESTRQAAQQVKDAESGLADAQQQARQVQEDLTQARKDAAQQLEDLATRVQDASLSQAESTLAIARAQERLNQVKADPKASDLDRKEAELALQRAQFSAQEQSKNLQRLRQEKADADKAGVDGSKQVEAAQQRIVDANKNVVQAEKAVADARHQQQDTARRDAFQVAQAQQAIVAAQRSMQSSAINMAKVAVPAIDKVHDAMANLSPAGRDFARFLFGLKPGLDNLRGAAQSELFPKLESAIRTLTPLMPTLKTGIKDVATAMGDAAITFAKALLSPQVRQFLTDLFATAPDAIREMGILAGKATRALATIFDQSIPSGKILLHDVVENLSKFFDRISTPQGKKALGEFFTKGIDSVRALGTLIGGVVDLMGAFLGVGGKAGQNPLADMMRTLAGLLHKLADGIRDNKGSGDILLAVAGGFAALKVIGAVLGPLKTVVGLIGGLRTALGIGGAAEAAAGAADAGGIAGALEGIGVALGAVALPVLVVVAALAAIAAGFYFAYTRSEEFRDVVWKAIHAVGDAFTWVWSHLIHPVFTFLRVELDVLWAFIQVTFGLIEIGLKLLGMAWMALYGDYIKPWWVDNVQPLLNDFGDFLDKHVVPKIRTAVRIIGNLFGDLASWWKSGFSDAIDLVNELLGVYNRLADLFGVKPDNVHVDNPFKSSGPAPTNSQIVASDRASFGHAAGGLILGPGTGTSDSIPGWLSNNEYVIRAERVRALGVPFLDWLNGSPRRGGDGTHFAGGGLVGSVLDTARGVASAVSDPAKFLIDQAKALFKNLPDMGIISDFVMGIPGKMITGMVDLVKGAFTGSGNAKITGSPAILALGQQMAAARGWTGAEWSALQQLWQHESGWNPTAKNPSSTAFGIPQFLSSTAAAYGLTPGDSNPQHQIAAGLRYVAAAYGDPINAWAKWQSRSPHWYDDGGWLMPGSTLAVNGTGKPEKVLTAEQYAAMAGGRGRGAPAEKPTININYPPFVPPEQALVDAQARADLVTW